MPDEMQTSHPRQVALRLPSRVILSWCSPARYLGLTPGSAFGGQSWWGSGDSGVAGIVEPRSAVLLRSCSLLLSQVYAAVLGLRSFPFIVWGPHQVWLRTVSGIEIWGPNRTPTSALRPSMARGVRKIRVPPLSTLSCSSSAICLPGFLGSLLPHLPSVCGLCSAGSQAAASHAAWGC